MIEILTINEVVKEYGLNYKLVRAYMNMKDCPVLPRVKGAPYRIIRSEWEAWLLKKSRH